MQCARCGGLMAYEQFWDLYGDDAVWNFSGFRCVHCGDIVDPIIVRNRLNEHIPAGEGEVVLSAIPTA